MAMIQFRSAEGQCAAQRSTLKNAFCMGLETNCALGMWLLK